MSKKKVDLEVFKLFAQALGYDDNLTELVYQCCNNELHNSNYEIASPERGDRKWDDESYRAEYKIWKEGYDCRQEEIMADFGYKLLESESSGEGGGEYCEGVFELKGKIYQANYNYYSHQGHEYDWIVDTLCEVVPKEITKTIYVNA